MNQEVKNKALAYLDEEARRFDMTVGIVTKEAEGLDWEDDTNLLGQPPCGTACCFAGAVYLACKGLSRRAHLPEWQEVQEYAMSALGVDRGMADMLFHLNYWPVEAARAYHDSKTPAARVESLKMMLKVAEERWQI